LKYIEFWRNEPSDRSVYTRALRRNAVQLVSSTQVALHRLGLLWMRVTIC